MGKIFCLMGKSASGKDTIYKRILEALPLRTIILYTTRPIREGEEDGVEYFFVDEEMFSGLQKTGKVIEARTYETVCGPWTYFMADDGQVQLEEGNYLVIGTIESFKKIRQYYGKEAVCPLYLELEDGIRLSRALEREKVQTRPRYAEMCRRFLADELDFSRERLEEAGIVTVFKNEDGDKCLSELVAYMREQM